MANEATFSVPDKLWSVKSEDMIHRKLRNSFRFHYHNLTSPSFDHPPNSGTNGLHLSTKFFTFG